MPKTAMIPDAWPRSMRDVVAAAYTGLSVTAFHALVKSEDIPAPVRLTPGVVTWYKEDLDAWLDARHGRAPHLHEEQRLLESLRG